MMVNEFIERTQYRPTAEEYDFIQESYILSNLHKDEFCRRWRRLNKGIIKKQKEQDRRREIENKLRYLYTYTEHEGIHSHEIYIEIVEMHLNKRHNPEFWHDILKMKLHQRKVFHIPFDTRTISVFRKF